MEFHSALAESHDLEEACDAIASEVERALGRGPIDLLWVFASAQYGRDLDRLPVLLHERIGARTLLGGSSAGAMTGNSTTEGRRAVSVLAGRMPGATVGAVHVSDADLPHGDAPPSDWLRLLPAMHERAGPLRGLALLADPFHCDVRSLIAGLDFALPRLPKVGGIASGSHHPAGNALFCGRSRVTHGAVLLTIAGDVTVTPVVSQGCRPVGRAGRITRADNNRLAAVDGQPAKAFVDEQLRTLPDHERALARQSPLFLGIASDPFGTEMPDAGQFLVRNVLGIDANGNLVVGDRLAIGRPVQLHLRDGTSGSDDLASRLQRARAGDAAATLMFRCVGRVGNDSGVLARVAPDTCVLGGTCNGELGPIGNTTYLHAYTTSCLLLGTRPGGDA